jgi:hypothetical protein
VVRKDEQEDVLRECHSGVAGGHYAGEVTVRKVWQRGLWWPGMQTSSQRNAICANERCRSVHSTPLQINRSMSIHTIHIIRA